MEGGAWWATVHGVAKSQTRLSDFTSLHFSSQAFQVALVVKNLPASAGDAGLIPESGRSPGVGSGNPLQYSCLENPMDGGAWWATVHGVAKSRTRLSDFTFTLGTELI